MSILLTLALVAPQSPVVKHLAEGPQVGAPAGVALAAGVAGFCALPPSPRIGSARRGSG